MLCTHVRSCSCLVGSIWSCLVLCLVLLVLSCLVLSCLVLSCLVLSCRVVSCCVVSCRVVSCRVVSCHVVSCRVVSCLVLSCLVLSCFVLSCLVLSCPVLSCPVLSCLVLSNEMMGAVSSPFFFLFTRRRRYPPYGSYGLASLDSVQHSRIRFLPPQTPEMLLQVWLVSLVPRKRVGH